MCYYENMKRKGFKEQKFTAFFEKNELNGYTVVVPSLPGLVTEGRTFEEAKVMAHDAITCYIQGLKKSYGSCHIHRFEKFLFSENHPKQSDYSAC